MRVALDVTNKSAREEERHHSFNFEFEMSERSCPTPIVADKANCVYCTNEGILVLTCKVQHKICQSCLHKNIERFGSDRDAMFSCPECTATHTKQKYVWIFADNSNIWIEAMKHAAKTRGFIKEQDHRARIDIGRLTDVVASGREVKQAILYGSEPPKVDTVWNKINQYDHWRVKTKERSKVTGKEKEVDTELVTDVTEVACRTPPHLQGTVIIISGDRDICPAIEKTLKGDRDRESNWSIEIHVWKHAHTLLTRLDGFKKLYESRVSCYLLDDNMKRVTFHNRQLLPKSKWLSKYDNCAAIICVKECNISKDIIKNEEWWEKIESATHWPVEYFQPEGPNKEKYLILAFRGIKPDYLEQLVKDLNNPPHESFKLDYVEKCEFYPSFKQRTQRGRGRMVTDEEGWTTVVKRNITKKAPEPSSATTCGPVPAKESVGTRVTPGTQKIKCCSGKNCEEGRSCRFVHTPNEKRYFDGRQGKVGNKYRKTQDCLDHRDNPPCKDNTEWCNYAHEEEDRWCLNCHTHGHFYFVCNYDACSHPRHH